MDLLEKMLLTGYLTWTCRYDVRKRAVPMRILLWGGVFAVVDIMEMGWESGRVVAMLPGILLLLLSKVTGGIGEADGIVLAFVGFICRNQSILLISGISLLYIFFYSMILFCTKRDRRLQIPYLPFLLAAYLTTWIIGG